MASTTGFVTQPNFPGYARVDAVGAILNEVTMFDIDSPGNEKKANAPVRYPYIWGTPQSAVVQYSGFAANNSFAGLGLGSLGRNVGEVLGVHGRINVPPVQLSDGNPNHIIGLKKHDPWIGYGSTVLIGNLGEIESWVATLHSPAWPAKLFGPIDTDLSSKGKDIYDMKCAKCHEVVSRQDQSYQPHMIQASVIGTDPVMVDNLLLQQNPDKLQPWGSGKLEGKSTGLFASHNFDDHLKVRGDALTKLATDALREGVLFGPTVGALQKSYVYNGSPQPQFDPRSYKARPLNGIWAVAPYFHNGSVRTLMQLLTRDDQREPRFRVGSREFDPKDVGFANVGSDEDSYLFDTTRPGNSNGGHSGSDYGTDLSSGDKRALIEYLKSL
jgi:hypothetical protein